MKKILFGLLSVCMIIVSCKKENSKATKPNQVSYKVGFNVRFSQRTAKFQYNSATSAGLRRTTIDTTLKSQVDVIYYAIYDSVGNNVYRARQLSADNGFGSATYNLSPGKYTVAIGAGKTGFVLGPPPYNNTSNVNTDVIRYMDTPISTYDPFVFDTFFKRFTLNVSNGNSTQTVSLDRIVSEITVDIKDALPPNAKSVGMIVKTGFYDRFFVGNSTTGPASGLYPLYFTNPILKADSGKTGYKISGLILAGSQVSINLYCNDATQLAIAQKNISNVTTQPNTQTILTGNLFGGSGTTNSGNTSGFHVTIDTTWNPNPIVGSFP